MTESQTTGAPITPIAALDDLFQPFARSDSPGLVVGVARHGKTLYRRGLGLASVELGVANTPWTRMRIGSTSKHFTCLAALLLAEEGKLDLDVDVRRYLPELPELDGERTLRQLMTHSSGLRDYLDLSFITGGLTVRPKGLALPAQVRQSEANFPAGEMMLYCNGGYHLLSIAIARAASMPFDLFMKQRIFEPLGMTNTDCAPSDLEIQRGMATLHVPLPAALGGGYRRGIFPTEEVLGEGSIISTLDDMLRWLAHLRAPEKLVGSAGSWSQMFEPSVLNNGLIVPYALGLICNRYRGVDVIHHAGGVIGGSCQMITVPAQGLDIIIMTNGALANAVDLSNKIIDIFLGDEILGPTPVAGGKAGIDRFKALPGTRYCSRSSDLVIEFSEMGGRLCVAPMCDMPMPLRDEGDTLRLAFEDLVVGPLVFKTDELVCDAPAPSLEVSDGGQTMTFDLLKTSASPISEEAIALLGRYRCNDLDADALLVREGDILKLKIHGSSGLGTMLVTSYSSDVLGLTLEGSLLPVRGVIKIGAREQEGKSFRLSTLRTRNLRFVAVD